MCAHAFGSRTLGCFCWEALGHVAGHPTAGGEGDGAGLWDRDGAARLCSWPRFRELNPMSLSSCPWWHRLRAPCASC